MKVCRWVCYLLRVCRRVWRVWVTLGQHWDGMATSRRCSRSSDEAPLHHLESKGEGKGTCETGVHVFKIAGGAGGWMSRMKHCGICVYLKH